MFILEKGTMDLDEACEYAQKLEKDFKMYSSEISSPSFSLYDEKCFEVESKISLSSKLEEQVDVLCYEVISLQKGRNFQIITHDTKCGLTKRCIQNSHYNFSSPSRDVECFTLTCIV